MSEGSFRESVSKCPGTGLNHELCGLPSSSAFLMDTWKLVGIRNSFNFIVSRGLGASFVQNLPIIFHQPVERGFGAFIHSADGSHETGGHEGFHSIAELFRGLFSKTRHFGLQFVAPRVTSGKTIRVEHGERGNYPFRCFGKRHIELPLRLPPEFLQAGIHRVLHQRLSFRRTPI